MNRNSVFNFTLFVVLAAAVAGTWWYVEKTYFPPPPKPEPEPAKPDARQSAREAMLAVVGGGGIPEPLKPRRETVLALTGAAAARGESLIGWPMRYTPEAPKPVAAPPRSGEPHRLVALGGPGFNKRVLLTSKGGAVQQVILPAFDQANRLGREVKDASGTPYPLELIPGYVRERDGTSVFKDADYHPLAPTESKGTVDAATAAVLAEPSYALFHYPAVGDPDRQPEDKEKSHERFPSPDLGTRTWKVVEEVPGTDDADARVVFETTLGDPYQIKIRKTFTLARRDYHVRMKLEFVGLDGRTTDKEKRAKFKYQIAGAHGLPVEGEWYTGTFRNAQVGWKTKTGTGKRDIQDAATVSNQHGGESVEPNGNQITYAAVSTQYFASALAVAPDAPDEEWRKDPWQYVRATREASPGVPEDKPQLGDITVRAVARPVNPDAGQTVEHDYWIYDGPIKVRLLKHLDQLEKGKQGYTADDATVDRYLDDLALYTLTDAPTPNAFGRFADAIYWTDLVVFFTNLMHGVLGWLHRVVPVWGIDIILLTFLVRLLLMVPSRRQQASMLKMQEKMAAMKPEIDKLAEKYKGDPQRLNQEKTRLMLQSGVNPLSSMGGCLLMFAQLPVFMGLYWCLQESVFFRLDRFLWVDNLAAPDMLLRWGEGVPYLTAAESMGGTFYFGPFLNILPVLAVALMYLNMHLSTPPATDEQTEMNQKMMKIMMIFMGVFFYKMAAGMCVYFIVSTTWGLIERKLLKKKKPDATLAPEPAPALITDPGPAKKTAATANGEGGGLMSRFRQKMADAMEEAQRRADTSRQIVNNPQPPKPGQQPPGPRSNGSGGGKKKRRKK